MKRVFNPYLFVAGMLVLSVPATSLAQDDKEIMKREKELANKEKELAKKERELARKEGEQIIITRTGDRNEKTVIEINGEAITVNGKNVKELKGAVSVQRHRLRDVDAVVMAPGQPPMPPRAGGNFNFRMNEDAISLFSEDSSRAMLGVMTSEDERGALITSVNLGSGAEKAGLKAGDVITRMGDTKIGKTGDVTTEVRKRKPGDKVAITYLRDGKEQKTTAELTQWKGLRINANGDNFRVMVPGRVAPFGPNESFDFRDFNLSVAGNRPRLGISIQDTEDGKGVVVKEVEDDGAAAKAGVKEGDIITHFNDVAVNDVNEMRRELAKNRDNASNKIKMLRNGKEQTVEVKTPKKLKTADL